MNRNPMLCTIQVTLLLFLLMIALFLAKDGEVTFIYQNF